MSLDALRSGAGIGVVEVNGAPMRLAEAGTGPLLVLLHGFPECWYSWRHQLRALAEAGFHAVAPNQRGYPGTHTPSGVADYTMLHLVSDVVGLIGALGEPNATSATTGAHRWPGTPLCCARTWYAASAGSACRSQHATRCQT
jgi:pimeloyl-ACP methyl ester carboxylesterase